MSCPHASIGRNVACNCHHVSKNVHSLEIQTNKTKTSMVSSCVPMDLSIMDFRRDFVGPGSSNRLWSIAYGHGTRGMGLHLVASILLDLANRTVWRGASLRAQLKNAWLDLKVWTRANHITCSHPCFTPANLGQGLVAGRN